MRPKMPDSQRAKQFMTFKPLEGLDEGMRRKVSGEVSFIDGELIIIDGQE